MPAFTIPVSVTKEQHAVLKDYAKLWDMPMSELIRLSIAWYIKNRIKKSRFKLPPRSEFLSMRIEVARSKMLNREVLEDVYGHRPK